MVDSRIRKPPAASSFLNNLGNSNQIRYNIDAKLYKSVFKGVFVTNKINPGLNVLYVL